MDKNLGYRLRQRRQELRMSLREVADKTGLTASFLSQVERSKVNPSLDSLRRIAEELEVPLLYFLSENSRKHSKSSEQTYNKGHKYNPVMRSNLRPKIMLPVSGVVYEKLILDLNRKMEPFCGRLFPGTGNIARRLREPTEEFIYVISGALLIGLGSEEYILYKDDSIYFEGEELQKLACASEDEDVVWISIITPPVF